MLNAIILFFVGIKICVSVPPASTTTEYFQNFGNDLKDIKLTLKMTVENLEKWNDVYISQVGPKILSFVNTQANVDSNVRNILERSHVWDTFQLHVAAWNDQLSTSDRKLDIISKTQQDTLRNIAKIVSNLNFDYKFEQILKKLDEFDTSILKLNKKMETINYFRDDLLGEFTIRGMFSSLKLIENKLDTLQRSNQNYIAMHHSILKRNQTENFRKLIIRCNTPPGIQNILDDIATKIDAIFDKIDVIEINEKVSEDEEYLYDGFNSNDGEESNVELANAILRRVNQPWKRTNKMIEELMEYLQTVNNNVLTVVENYKENNSKPCPLPNFDDFLNSSHILNQDIEHKLNNLEEIINSSFVQQQTYIHEAFTARLENVCNKENKTFSVPNNENTVLSTKSYEIKASNASSCDNLKYGDESGFYNFSNLYSKTSFSIRYCQVLEDGGWTVIQNRDNFPTLQNFTLNWYSYKIGFGKLNEDFWIGNDFLYTFSQVHDLILRIELEDFEENLVWAEYGIFKVASENDNYRLTIGDYRGNATDSLSSHNGSLFSTFDVKNDDAPECCPCANSYGGGWWFNSCFECNLNGVYHRAPHSNEHFRGIIWEGWLGDYSLKKSKMMIKKKPNNITNSVKTTEFSHYSEIIDP